MADGTEFDEALDRLIYPAVASFDALVHMTPLRLDTALPEFVRDDPNHGIEAMATLADAPIPQ